jgi:hypothetical protein
VFPGVQYGLVLQEGTFLKYRPRNLLNPKYFLFEEHSKFVSVCAFVCSHAFVCVYVCVCERALGIVCCMVFLLSVSVRYSIPKSAIQECFLEVKNVGLLKLLFLRSIIIHSVRRKYSTSMAYVQCMSGCQHKCINVHHWLV